jgi:hypothetical protein
MAQNISSLLQMAQQQYGNQGTDASTQADTADSSSVDVLKGMMARGGAAQELAQQRNLENQKRLQTLFAEAGVGPQGLLNTLGIGLGNALGQSLANKNPDGEMQRANEIDSLTGQSASSNDPNQLYEIGRRLIALGDHQTGGQMISLANNYRSIAKSEAVEQQLKENIRRTPEVIKITDENGNVVSHEIRTWNDQGEELRRLVRPDDMELLMGSLGQNNPAPTHSPLPNEVIPNPPPIVIDMFKNLPEGSIVPIAGETYVITKGGAVMQEKPINGRGARGRRSRAQGGK